jgi:hypothetical protein
MNPRRIPLLALAAFALGAPAQQPASPAQPAAATAQQPAPANSAAAPKGNPAPPARANSAAASHGKPAQAQPGSAAPAPQGNLIIQVTDDNGTPFPGAAVEIDGMGTGMAPPGSAQAAAAAAESGSPQATVAPPVCAHSNRAPSEHAETGHGETGDGQPHPGGDQAGNGPSDAGAAGTAQASSAGSGAGQAEPEGNGAGGDQPNAGSSGTKPAGSGHPDHTQEGDGEPQPSGPQLCTVEPGTAQSISSLTGVAAPAAGAPLPPGAVQLVTDAQGQLILQLPSGLHTVAVSVYGFDPFNAHFTLNGKHRQVIQIKLSTAPTSYVIAVGPDGRIQPVSADLDTMIPLEPVAVLDPLPVRGKRHAL